jgi:hypothetical protein
MSTEETAMTNDQYTNSPIPAQSHSDRTFTLPDGREVNLDQIGHFYGLVLFDKVKSEIEALLRLSDRKFILEEIYGDRQFTVDEAISIMIAVAMNEANEDGRETIYALLTDMFGDNEIVMKQLLRVVSDYPALLRSIPYKDYLRTDHWQEVRHTALERAEGRCQVCNSKERLHTHHRTYKRRGEEWPTDVIVLCADCHRMFHDNGKLARDE